MNLLEIPKTCPNLPEQASSFRRLSAQVLYNIIYAGDYTVAAPDTKSLEGLTKLKLHCSSMPCELLLFRPD